MTFTTELICDSLKDLNLDLQTNELSGVVMIGPAVEAYATPLKILVFPSRNNSHTLKFTDIFDFQAWAIEYFK